MIENTKKSLSELWRLLKNKQKELGIDDLDLKEQETLQQIIYLQGEKKEVELEKIYQQSIFPRASFFRYLKALKEKKYVSIKTCNKDARKTLLSVSSILK